MSRPDHPALLPQLWLRLFLTNAGENSFEIDRSRIPMLGKTQVLCPKSACHLARFEQFDMG
jgi:hypothetical protein